MYGNIIDSSSDNVPTSFSTAAGSRLVASAPTGGQLLIISEIAKVLAITVDRGPNAPGSTLPGKQAFIPAAPTGGSGVASFELKIRKGDSVYVRSTGTAASSGKLYWTII